MQPAGRVFETPALDLSVYETSKCGVNEVLIFLIAITILTVLTIIRDRASERFR